jgi:hypothetical protein
MGFWPTFTSLIWTTPMIFWLSPYTSCYIPNERSLKGSHFESVETRYGGYSQKRVPWKHFKNCFLSQQHSWQEEKTTPGFSFKYLYLLFSYHISQNTFKHQKIHIRDKHTLRMCACWGHRFQSYSWIDVLCSNLLWSMFYSQIKNMQARMPTPLKNCLQTVTFKKNHQLPQQLLIYSSTKSISQKCLTSNLCKAVREWHVGSSCLETNVISPVRYFTLFQLQEIPNHFLQHLLSILKVNCNFCNKQ